MNLSWMDLPAVVTCEIAPFSDLERGLMSAEATSLSPLAGERRRRDYIAGRYLARRLLATHGYGDYALVPTPAGMPQWPTGITGSISHCRDLVFVAVAAIDAVDAIGIDIEDVTRFHDGLADSILTVGERARLPDEDAARRQQMAVIFSTKEAFYKYQHVLFEEKLDFQDAEVCLHAPGQTSTIAMTNPERHGHLATGVLGFYALSNTHVATMILRRHQPGHSNR